MRIVARARGFGLPCQESGPSVPCLLPFVDSGAASAAVATFALFVLASPLGLLFALLPSPLYDAYVQVPRLWGLQPLEDQQIGGTLMAVSEAIVFFGLLAYFFVRFMAEEDAGYSHGDA